MNTWMNRGEGSDKKNKGGFNKRRGDNAFVSSVISAGIVFSGFRFHGSWKNNGAARLFIIKMCSLKEFSVSSQHIHLLRNNRRQRCRCRCRYEAAVSLLTATMQRAWRWMLRTERIRLKTDEEVETWLKSHKLNSGKYLFPQSRLHFHCICRTTEMRQIRAVTEASFQAQLLCNDTKSQ